MEIKIVETGSVNVLSLQGKMDLANAGLLKAEVKTLLEAGKCKVHLDMQGVDFINSSGLGALVSIMKEIRVFKGRLTMSGLAPYVNEIFEITQLSHVFEIFDTVESAQASYAEAPTA
ncbi:MAG: STAS domain-containing protein [FCB group bacterium]|nr:STAS domain-containing protein [FCB group bacterium]